WLCGPFELHGVFAPLLGLPRADVTDLAVAVVVPPLPGDNVGDRFAQLVGARRRQSVERGQPAGAAGATRVGHHRVGEGQVEVVVVAAERLTRSRAALNGGPAGREGDK